MDKIKAGIYRVKNKKRSFYFVYETPEGEIVAYSIGKDFVKITKPEYVINKLCMNERLGEVKFCRVEKDRYNNYYRNNIECIWMEDGDTSGVIMLKNHRKKEYMDSDRYSVETYWVAEPIE